MDDPFGEALAAARLLVPLVVYPVPEPWPTPDEPASRDDTAPLGTDENSDVRILTVESLNHAVQTGTIR